MAERSLLTGQPLLDWKKIAVQAVEAIGECCGCSITGWDAERYLKEHLTPKEHKALLDAYAEACNNAAS